jgi:hypothetical protein
LGFEDGFVAVVIGEFDLDGAVIEQCSGAVAGDLVHFVEASQVKTTDDRLFDVEAGLESANYEVGPYWSL